MSTEPYTPSVEAVCARYFNGDYSGCNRNPDTEFDRFIAKVKTDMLREAALELTQVNTRAGVAYPTRDSIQVRAMADRIEGEA